MANQTACIDHLSATQAGLICSLSPGINPDEWGQLCRFLGGLAPGEFDMLATMIHDWQRFFEKALCALEVEKQRSGAVAVVPGTPLFSLGPSGIGGAYQFECDGPDHKQQGERI